MGSYHVLIRFRLMEFSGRGSDPIPPIYNTGLIMLPSNMYTMFYQLFSFNRAVKIPEARGRVETMNRRTCYEEGEDGPIGRKEPPFSKN